LSSYFSVVLNFTLFKESEQIIVATDAGREGELIFRYLYHYTGCTTPFVCTRPTE